MEKLVEWLARETEVLGENLPQCRFVHHKPHMLPVREPGPKFRDSPSTRPRPLPSKSFPIHHSSVILPFDTVYSRRWQSRDISKEKHHNAETKSFLFILLNLYSVDELSEQKLGILMDIYFKPCVIFCTTGRFWGTWTNKVWSYENNKCIKREVIYGLT
jgi:hypothetical protein